MKRDFDTVIFSPALNFFGEKFGKRWGLDVVYITHNTNINLFRESNKPLIIVGAHFFNPNNPLCIKFRKIIEVHKGPQVFLLGGAGDTNMKSMTYIKNRNKKIPTYAFVQDDTSHDFLNSLGMGHKKVYIPFKSYNRYKPTKLGNKIWFHVGFSAKDNVKERYGFDSVVKPLIKEFGIKRVAFINPNGPVRSEDFLHKRYEECFVYVKPNPNHGSTTMWEMGYMGRRTICPGHKDLKNVVTCPGGIKEGKNHNQLIELIKREESRIDTVQPEVSEFTKLYHIQDDRWLNLNFWKKWNGV